MPLYDLPLDELRTHRTEATEPAGLDEFWAEALARARVQQSRRSSATGTARTERSPRTT